MAVSVGALGEFVSNLLFVTRIGSLIQKRLGETGLLTNLPHTGNAALM